MNRTPPLSTLVLFVGAFAWILSACTFDFDDTSAWPLYTSTDDAGNTSTGDTADSNTADSDIADSDIVISDIVVSDTNGSTRSVWDPVTCQIVDDGKSTGNGSLAVSSINLVAGTDGTTVYYPTILADSECTFAMVVLGNGTSAKTDGNAYPEYFNHLAGHGFIVVVAHTNMTMKQTQPMLTSLGLVFAAHDEPSSVFYQKVRPEFGLAGKSQGAYAVARHLGETNAVAGVFIGGGAGTNTVTKPGLFATGDIDFLKRQTLGAYEAYAAEAVYAQAAQPQNPGENSAIGGHMDLDTRVGIVELTTSFMRCYLRGDDGTCDHISSTASQTEPWSVFQTKGF